MSGTSIASNDRAIKVRMPMAIRRRGGRKLVLAPVGAEVAAPIAWHVGNAIIKAIARAFRWRGVLESGEHATIREISHAEKINETYVGRVLRLTLLAPEIVETILNGRQPAELHLERLLRPFPIVWQEQRASVSEH